MNSRGKTDTAALHRLFDTKDYLPILTTIESTPNRIVAQALYLKDSPWVAGHFPGYPITPGVIILRSISALTTQHWGAGIRRIQRLKFNAPVIPGDEVYLILQRKAQRLDVLLSRTPDGNTPTCKGVCHFTN